MISIILINYHTEQLIIDCIHSCLKVEHEAELEFIVVNNGGSLIQLDAHFSGKLNVIESGGNLGFSKANNLGFKHARGEFIVFLNSDTLFIEPVLESLVSQLNQNKSIGVISSRLLNEDGSLQYSYHDGDHLFSKLWRRNPLAIKFFRATKRIKTDQDKISKLHETAHHAAWLSGAFWVMRKMDIEKHGWSWDEDFFMYWEDVELSYRIKKAGFSVFYLPEKKLIHLGGGGDKEISNSRFEMMEDAKLLFLEKTKGVFSKKLYVFLMRLELKIEAFLMEKKKETKSISFKNEFRYYTQKNTRNEL